MDRRQIIQTLAAVLALAISVAAGYLLRTAFEQRAEQQAPAPPPVGRPDPTGFARQSHEAIFEQIGEKAELVSADVDVLERYILAAPSVDPILAGEQPAAAAPSTPRDGAQPEGANASELERLTAGVPAIERMIAARNALAIAGDRYHHAKMPEDQRVRIKQALLKATESPVARIRSSAVAGLGVAKLRNDPDVAPRLKALYQDPSPVVASLARRLVELGG
jgi:hypothetical protein